MTSHLTPDTDHATAPFDSPASPIDPVDLFDAMVRLRPGGAVEVGGRQAAVDDRGGWTITAFHAPDSQSVHADTWERHTAGDEVVAVLAGRMRAVLRGERGARDETVELAAGRSVVVPRGAWHRLEVLEPADLLSVTPRTGTRRERVA